MGNRNPAVSIGLPVYNGERYLALAIRSVLEQTFEDFELIISDNASTDGTQEMAREFARADRRVRYQRMSRNLGPARNFNRLTLLARGRYFQWISHDDLWAPSLLAELVSPLDIDESVILSHSRVHTH
jgi:glycosyltransferase involved in cell wall biosynthesis